MKESFEQSDLADSSLSTSGSSGSVNNRPDTMIEGREVSMDESSDITSTNMKGREDTIEESSDINSYTQAPRQSKLFWMLLPIFLFLTRLDSDQLVEIIRTARADSVHTSTDSLSSLDSKQQQICTKKSPQEESCPSSTGLDNSSDILEIHRGVRADPSTDSLSSPDSKRQQIFTQVSLQEEESCLIAPGSWVPWPRLVTEFSIIDNDFDLGILWPKFGGTLKDLQGEIERSGNRRNGQLISVKLVTPPSSSDSRIDRSEGTITGLLHLIGNEEYPAQFEEADWERLLLVESEERCGFFELWSSEYWVSKFC